jgi:F420-non-reducing hydrogenase iron-sulfur subunit
MKNSDNSFEPKIIGFLCKWCSYAGADLAGTSRIEYPPNVIPIQVMCSSRIDPSFVISAFVDGADGVLIAGCHAGDCHYQNGNYKTRRRIILLKKMLEGLGIKSERLKLEWVSAAEGKKFAQVITEFTNQIRALGPLKL